MLHMFGNLGPIFMVLLLFVVVMYVFQSTLFVEGMENMSGSSGSSSGTNGIAGNAENYAANLKTEATRKQDALLISKYRVDYENSIMSLDDLVNNLMLETAMSVDLKKPEVALKKLADLQQSKVALNSVMKFVDNK